MKQKLLLVGTALALTGGVISMRNNVVNQVKAEDPVEVSNYAELQDAVENTRDRKIVLTDDIIVSVDDVDSIDPWRSSALLIEGISNMEIDGNGHVLQANVTGFDEKGFLNDEPFSKSLIEISDNSSITIKNLIIKGGDRAAISVCDSNLKMFNSTIERSGSVYESGTGINASSSKVYLKDSKISRCGGEYGGGFINSSGWFVLDGCSLNENRSLSYGGGGGGCENNSDGYSIFNNCTIANNVSTEIGGGINNYGANLLIMNSTIVGNLTNNGIGYGGGVGNNGGNLALYNSLLTNNYFVDNEGAHKSDIGLFDYDFNPDSPEDLPWVYSFGSKVDEITNEYRGVYPFDIEGITKIDSEDSDFAKVVDQAGVLYSSNEEKFYISKNIHRPVIVLNDVGTYSCYLGNESSMLEGGCPTYFYVPEDMDDWDPSTIIAGYKDNSGYKGCAINASSTFSAPEDESFRVNKFQDGTDRIEGVIGSNGVKEINMVSLTVYPGTKGCKADFGTVFGELYPINTTVSINPILQDPSQDVFLYWEDCLDSSKTYPQDYFVNFSLDKDYAIRPFVDDQCIITNLVEEANHEIYGGYISAPETVPFNSKIEIEVHPDDGYSLVCLGVSDDLTMDYNFVTDVDNLYSGEGGIELDAYFWKGKNPVAKKNLKFNNSDQELIEPGVNGDIRYSGDDYPETGHFEYSLTGLSDDYSEDVPTAKDAGEYTVYWKYVGSFVSWLERSGKFDISIDKIKVAKPDEDSTSFTYNGEDQTYTIAANSAYEITGNVAKDAGTYTVTVALKDKTNTCWSDGSINDLTFDFIIAEEDKACFLHWISIGLLVVAAALFVLHIVLKYKALIAYVALGVIDAGAVVTGLLGFILNNCFFCLGTLIGNFVIISLMIAFVFVYEQKRKEDLEDKKE